MIKNRFKILLIFFILIIISNQIIVQNTISKQSSASETINIAGKQRQYSQQISKIALKFDDYKRDSSFNKKVLNLKQIVDRFKKADTFLKQKNSDESDNEAIKNLFIINTPYFNNIVNASNNYIENSKKEGSLNEFKYIIKNNETFFLETMDTIVSKYQKNAEDGLEFLKKIQYLFIILTSISILGIIFFMFLPIFRKNRELNKLNIKLEKFQKEVQTKEGQIRKARKTLDRTNTIARIGTWEVNLKKEKVTWSKVTKEIHGADNDFIPDLNSAMNFYKEGYSRDKITEVVENSMQKNINWDEELQIVTTTGKNIWVRSIGKTIFKDDKPYRMFGTFQDINTSKISQIELKKANEELGAILNLDTISIIRTDLNGIITYFNEGAETLLGYKSEEIVNKEKPSLFHDKKEIIRIGKELSEKYNKEISGFGVFETLAIQDDDLLRKWKYLKKDGSFLYMQLSINAIRDKDGAIIAFIGVGTDVTKLTEQNNQLANFAQIASHNLRAPVSNLSSLLTLYDISESEEDKEFTFNKFRTVISHLSDTLNTLIQAIKIREKKEVEIQIETLSFSEVFKKTIEITSEEIKKLNAEITSDFSVVDTIEYNEPYLESAFINLISNSLRYSSPDRNPKIEVKTSLKNGKIQLSIMDNGLGIDLEKHGHRMFGLNHVFHRHKDSQGVGLYMLKNQIEALKGTIICTSEVDKGTTFTITF